MPPEYDLICIGTSFAASFFLHGYLKGAKPNARILVLERGERNSHQQLTKVRWAIRSAGDKTFTNTTKSKPWWYAPTFGGTSNMWFGNTPRMLPDDFQLRTKYGQGVDWPLTYEELEPFYAEAERLMMVAGSDRPGPFPRSTAYPLPAHELSEPERWLEKAQPQHFFPCPSARASRPVTGQRSGCCTSFSCNFCPVDAKFTVQNGLGSLYDDPRVQLEVGANVQALVLEGGVVKGVTYEKQGKTLEALGERVALGANAIFNPYILLNSGLEHPTLGRYLHEQTGRSVHVYLEKGQGFGGSTSCTGHNYRLAHGPHRKERAAVLLETHSKPVLRLESGRWRNMLRVTGVFEDLPQERNRVTVDKKRHRPQTQFKKISKYAQRAIESFEEDLKLLLEGLPVERIQLSAIRKSEGHILGTVRMGADAASGFVDSFQRSHAHNNLWVLGGSSFPTGPVANPSLTVAALSLRSASAAQQG